ncbi:rac gtpase-activating protein 1, partial [Lasius niger]
MITSIGQNFISSPLITCLNLTSIGIKSIQMGAFNKLPNLTQLFIFNNNINFNELFSFGGHENLKVLILNSATVQRSYHQSNIVDISEEHPNLEILSVRRNYVNDLQTLIEETPFSKLKILDLSSNSIKVITSIGQNFISNPLITCLNLMGTHINSIQKGAFNKL